ncbi:hypothetical protein TanjilG_05506 [Lupinus angustifolius]|uniref:Retroviral polymerase SH3-like domain-containing protein n=1 Tax=Lupinus angustifolius TaxID=3871 RepID=A0A1J7IDV1_LUPAN|nr:hypothetical protein TanjilG_05506 [Lupinus angustifolius]
MYQSCLPKCFWNFGAAHAVYLINRQPSQFLKNKCPYEILYNHELNLLNIKVFGCLCFASTLTHNRKKLDPRARKCVFLGFKQGTKGYIMFDYMNKETFLSRNVSFYENIFPFKNEENQHNQGMDISLPTSSYNNEDVFLNHDHVSISVYPSETPVTNNDPHEIHDEGESSLSNLDESLDFNNNNNQNLRKSSRQINAPNYLKGQQFLVMQAISLSFVIGSMILFFCFQLVG